MRPAPPHRCPRGLRHRTFAAAALAIGVWGGGLPLPAPGQEGEAPPAGGPAVSAGIAPVLRAHFDALLSNSPFLRSLDLSESIILTGIANLGGDLYVTLHRRDTKETHIVSEAANPEGMRLVGVEGNPADLGTVTARISLASGEVFAVRFDEQQLKPGEGKPAAGSSGGAPQGGGSGAPVRDYREGIPGDGFRGPPPPELVKKLSQLSEDQRNRLIQQIGEIRERNREMPSEERQAIFSRMVDRALQERR